MFSSGGPRLVSRLSVTLTVLMCAGCLTTGRQLLGKLEPRPDTASVEETTSKSRDSEPSKAAASEKTGTEGRERSTLTKPRIPDSEPEAAESKPASEPVESLPKPPEEPKQARPQKKFRNVREAAIEKARNTPGVSTIVLCPFSYDGTWQVVMYDEQEPKPTVREFVWNRAQGALEPTMMYPVTADELSSMRRKYSMMESCELLAYPGGSTQAEERVRPTDKPPLPADSTTTDLVKPLMREPRRESTPQPRISRGEDLRVQAADTATESPQDEQAVRDFMSTWKSVWERKDLDTFKSFYHPSFRAGRMVYDQFMDNKAKFFNKYRTISVEFDRVSVKKVRGGYQVRFLQRFQGDTHKDTGWKTMTLVGGKDQGFKIVSEEWSAQ